MKSNLKKTLNFVRFGLIGLFLILCLWIGIELYRIFLGYVPGVNINDLFQIKIGLSAFYFFALAAGILITFPVLIAAFEIFKKNSTSYVSYLTETGFVHLSDLSIESYVYDIVSTMKGVESAEVSIDVSAENWVGIQIWVNTDQDADYVNFSEEIQKEVLDDLSKQFGIQRIRFFHVYLEEAHIKASGNGFQVTYR